MEDGTFIYHHQCIIIGFVSFYAPFILTCTIPCSIYEAKYKTFAKPWKVSTHVEDILFSSCYTIFSFHQLTLILLYYIKKVLFPGDNFIAALTKLCYWQCITVVCAHGRFTFASSVAKCTYPLTTEREPIFNGKVRGQASTGQSKRYNVRAS